MLAILPAFKRVCRFGGAKAAAWRNTSGRVLTVLFNWSTWHMLSDRFYLQVLYSSNALCLRNPHHSSLGFCFKPHLVRGPSWSAGKRRPQTPAGSGRPTPTCRQPRPARLPFPVARRGDGVIGECPVGRRREDARCWAGFRSCARRRRRCSAWKRPCTTSWTGSRWPCAPHSAPPSRRLGAAGRPALRGAQASAAPAWCRRLALPHPAVAAGPGDLPAPGGLDLRLWVHPSKNLDPAGLGWDSAVWRVPPRPAPSRPVPSRPVPSRPVLGTHRTPAAPETRAAAPRAEEGRPPAGSPRPPLPPHRPPLPSPYCLYYLVWSLDTALVSQSRPAGGCAHSAKGDGKALREETGHKVVPGSSSPRSCYWLHGLDEESRLKPISASSQTSAEVTPFSLSETLLLIPARHFQAL